MNRFALITILPLVLACSGNKDTDTTDAGATGTGATDTSTGANSSPTSSSSSSSSPTNTTDADPSNTDTAVTGTSGTDTAVTGTSSTDTTVAGTATDTTGTGTTDTDTMDPTAADPVCGAGPAPGDTFMIDFGGEIGLQTFEQSGNTGCHNMNDAGGKLISLVWSSTTSAGFTVGAALFSGDYESLGELVGNTLPFAPTNQLSAAINAPGLGSYEAKGAKFGLHISSLTENGITGCLVDFDAFVRKGDGVELKPASPIPFACAK
jgi:hypothetical protein